MHSISAVRYGDVHDTADDEVALVRAAQAEPTAFAPLYQRYRHRVYAYLRARTRDEEDAADLTQQVFVQALDALPRYRERGATFAAWLFRIAHNALVNFYRHHRPVPLDLVPEALHPLAEQDLEAGALRQDDLARLRPLVDALDAAKREMLALRFAGGLTAAEIAVVIGKSEAATKKQLSRTLQTLKEQYHDDAR